MAAAVRVICGPAWLGGGCLSGQWKLERAAGPGRAFLGGEWGETAPILAAGPGSLDGVTWGGQGAQRGRERAALTPHLCCEALRLTCFLFCTLHEKEKAIFLLAQLASMAPFPCS